MADAWVEDRREYFRIKDRLAIEVRVLSDDEFIQLENTIKYSPTQIVDKIYDDMHFLKESLCNDQKEASLILAYLRTIDKKLDILINCLGKSDREEPYRSSYTEVEISGNGISFSSGLPIRGGDYLELGIIIPRFPYPKITVLGQVLKSEDCRDNEMGHSQVVAKFIVINEEDRDLLINYIFMKDREHLRLKKELMYGKP